MCIRDRPRTSPYSFQGLRAGGRSPRVAKQFIELLAGGVSV